MPTPPCPADEDLLPLAAGETVPEAVQSHLAACPNCRNRMERLRDDLGDLRSTPLPERRERSADRPAIIGKYLVVGELDSGGQSIVYRALHPTLDKELVIKLGREPVERGSGDRDLLVREGKLLASLEHPNLARVYDLDFHGDYPFVVMEYVRGCTLAEVVRTARPSPRDAAALLAPIARALGEVHRRGIIHQDIKPRNILIDENGRPKLIDFGMARLRHAWDRHDEPFGGTPAFTSPEQARGDSAQVTARSDIFGLGAVLYYMLTGVAPFEAPTASESLDRAAACRYDLAALDDVSPQRVRDICRRALAESPTERYERAEDLAADLEAVAAPARTRRTLLVGALGLAAVVAGIWVGRSLLSRPSVAPQMQVEVLRDGKFLDLAQALPINPATDSFRFSATLPADQVAALYRFDSTGEFERLATSIEVRGDQQVLQFPAHGKTIALKARVQRRTDVVVAVAAPSYADLTAFETWLRGVQASELAPLIDVPAAHSVRIRTREPQTQSFGETKDNPFADAEDRVERLSRRLREQVPVVVGVTLSY